MQECKVSIDRRKRIVPSDAETVGLDNESVSIALFLNHLHSWVDCLESATSTRKPGW